MSFIRTLWRVLAVTFLFVSGAIELLITRPATRRDRAAWLQRFCNRVLRAIDLTYKYYGPTPTHGAVIANHRTFLDIILYGALHPVVFVAKIEIRSMPLFGFMSMMSGTIYVARGAGGSANQAGESMAQGFADGLPVVFFPEGTTAVEETLLPFRSGLIAKTMEAAQPITASYTTYSLSARDLAEGKTVNQHVHWGTQSLPAQIWAFLSLHGVCATVRFAEAPIAFSPAALTHRKTAAEEAHAAVLALANTPTP